MKLTYIIRGQTVSIEGPSTSSIKELAALMGIDVVGGYDEGCADLRNPHQERRQSMSTVEKLIESFVAFVEGHRWASLNELNNSETLKHVVGEFEASPNCNVGSTLELLTTADGMEHMLRIQEMRLRKIEDLMEDAIRAATGNVLGILEEMKEVLPWDDDREHPDSWYFSEKELQPDGYKLEIQVETDHGLVKDKHLLAKAVMSQVALTNVNGKPVTKVALVEVKKLEEEC